MIINLLPDPPTSYVMNCIIKCKPENNVAYGDGIFIAQDGVVFARLNGYAIIPAEEYAEFADFIESKKKNAKV